MQRNDNENSTSSSNQKTLKRKSSTISDVEREMLKGAMLTQSMHERGICIRHLGMVRAASDHGRVRACLLNEAIARIVVCQDLKIKSGAHTHTRFRRSDSVVTLPRARLQFAAGA